MAAEHGKQQGKRQPDRNINRAQHQEGSNAQHLLHAGRHADHHKAHCADVNAKGKYDQHNDGGTGEEFCIDDRITVDRLGSQPVERAECTLVADRVKSQNNACQRAEESDERRKGIDRPAARGKQL